MKKTGILLLAGLLALIAGCGKSLFFGAAEHTGTYYEEAEKIDALLEKASVNVEVRETAGSAANLRLISEDYIKMAIVQADVVYRSLMEDPYAEVHYSAIMPLHTEACHIMVRGDSKISSVSDLAGKRIGIGQVESGTESNAMSILSAYGLSDQNTEMVNMDFEASKEALLDGRLDAVFATYMVGSSAVKSAAEEMELRFLSVTEDDLEALQAEYPLYELSVIPKGTYSGQKEDITALSMKAILIVSNEIKADTVKKMTETLYRNRSSILPEENVLPDRNEEIPGTSLPLPLHPGAEEFYRQEGLL